VEEGNGIGKDNTIPWAGGVKGDMAFFRQLTSSTHDPLKKNAVIMGRKTWESLPDRFRPLPYRLNIVLSSTLAAGVVVQPSLEAALAYVWDTRRCDVEGVFVIGGAQVYAAALAHPACTALFITRLARRYKCDVFFPEVPSRFSQCSSLTGKKTENDLEYDILKYTPAVPPPASVAAQAGVHAEHQYLDLIRHILDNGVTRGDRTGVGTVSVFGVVMRFNLAHSFPLLTTKRVFWRGVAQELLWFIAGCTDANKLKDKGIHIWDGNASKDFLTKRGLGHREEGDLGPVYGFQWRHFGAKYEDMHTDYTGKGVDQLQSIIDTIKSNPTDRRMVMSAWNPADLPLMALPPCHMFSQFYVADGALSCAMYQRSCDMGLGVPFNIASYALLTVLVAQCCGLRPGELVHVLGDAHVYTSHIPALREQLRRQPRPFPTLTVNPAKTRIDDFVFEDFTLEGYDPHPAIKMEMAV